MLRGHEWGHERGHVAATVSFLTLKMTTAQVVETSVTVTNSSFQNYTHPDDHTRQTIDTPGFKPFTKFSLCDIPVFAKKKKSVVYATCCIKLNWFEFVRHQAGTK